MQNKIVIAPLPIGELASLSLVTEKGMNESSVLTRIVFCSGFMA